MAPAMDSTYLPSLTACLDGDSKLLSWKRVALSLDASVSHSLDASVAKYLEDPATIQVLTNCFSPAKSSPQSKAEFDSLTSAINVTPTTNDHYDIKELKEDSLWLSKVTEIDEVSALRHIILEWQLRIGRQASLNLEEAELKDFKSAKHRRQRQLEIYFEQQQWLFRCMEIIAARGINGLPRQSSSKARRGAIETAAETLRKDWNLDATAIQKQDKSWLHPLRNYLQLQLDTVSGTDISSRDGIQDYLTDPLYLLSLETSIVQIIHGLQVILLLQWSLPRPSSPQLVTEWFSWMEATSFFGSWFPHLPPQLAHHQLQISELLALNSLAFIDVSASSKVLPDLASTSATSEGQNVKIYLQSVNCVAELNRVLGDSVEAGNEVVAPVAIAWYSLLTAVHIHATQSIEYRENRQAQKAIDNYGANQQSDNESLDGFNTRRRISPNRRHSFGSDTSGQATLLEDIDEICRSHPMGEDAVKHFGLQASDQLGGFSVVENIARSSLSRIDQHTSLERTTCIQEILVQFIKTCHELGSLDYSYSALNILLTILADQDNALSNENSVGPPSQRKNRSYQPLGDDPLLTQFLTSARGRFPYEATPFVELCRTLLPYQDFSSTANDLLFDILSEMKSYTALVHEPHIAYDLVGDSESLSLRLLDTYDALSMTFPSLLYNLSNSAEDQYEPLLIPAGTFGQALREEKPIVALWNLNYSALRLCGLTLQLQLQWRTTSHQGDAGHDLSNLHALNTEVIALLATWITKIISSLDGQTSVEKAQDLLANVSDDLDRNQDVVAVIFALLEGHLYKNKPNSSEAAFILRCMQFLVALAKVLPSRVWSFLSRSGLLGLHGQENRLIAIVAAAEISSGTYNILLTSVQLLDVLIEDSVRSASFLRTNSLALKRFRATDVDIDSAGAQATIMSKIIDQFTRIVVEVIETSSGWIFKSQDQELLLKWTISSILQKIISYTFDYDDGSLPGQKISANLTSAAEYIIDNFLSPSASDTLLSPLFKEAVEIIGGPTSSLGMKTTNLRRSVAISSLELSAQLVRLNKFLDHPVSKLTKLIRSEIGIFVTLFLQELDLQVAVIRVLDAVIRDIGGDSQPSPILGALSEPSAKAFVQSLCTIGSTSADPVLSASTWSLFSAAITNQQQWMTVYLTLGKTPRESLKNNSSPTSKPALRLALNSIADLETLHTDKALSVLEFVANSANGWASVTMELKNDKDCRRACLEYLSTLRASTQEQDLDAGAPVKFQIAAYIVNILAILVHQSNQQKDTATLKHLIPSLTYLVEHGVMSPRYNASLHHSFQRNFERAFPGSNLQHFKRTRFSQPRLGGDFYYDKTLAGKLFQPNQAWTGKGETERGFENEFTRANINLSLVEAQVSLFHSWKILAIELAEGLGDDAGYQNTMIRVLKNCLEANQGSNMPEAVFRKLCYSRADLAFTLLQRLQDTRSENQEIKGVLPIAWRLVQSQVPDIGSSLVSDEADYARILLRILYLSLCAHEDRTQDTISNDIVNTPTALDILQIVVAQGFRSLIGQLHENSAQVQPGDFVMIIAILRAALKIRGVKNQIERLQTHFDDEKTIHHAGTLISWSDQLVANGDPIYGELSMMFLLELSTVQALAEAIVVNGTLSLIASTTLFSYFRREGGCGPFDTPFRMYNIWSRGYLPLTLNVIGAIGAPVAVEIASTFEQFAPQLKRSSLQFDPKSSTSANSRTTLSMVSEAHSLALLNMALNKFREAGSHVGLISTELPQLPWDVASVKEDLESLLGRRHALRESIVSTDEREDQWSQQKPIDSTGGSQSRLEERIVEEITAALSLMGSMES